MIIIIIIVIIIMYLSLLLGFFLFLKKLESQPHKMFNLRHNCEIKMSQNYGILVRPQN